MATTDKKAAAAKAAPAKTETQGDERVLLRAKEPIRHDGKDVAPGEPFAALPDVAAGLLESGAADTAADAPADE